MPFVFDVLRNLVVGKTARKVFPKDNKYMHTDMCLIFAVN